ncbi:MAG: diaminopimelate decarboxylase [Anaerolineae bacterium]|jgi:diaminopimelate decarboxylase|nr:diaminopimelate decarboxylase [Anaerolineae bacterium]
MKHELLPVTASCSGGRLAIAGHDLGALAREFATPLYVYDGETVRQDLAALRQALAAAYPGPTEITYAAKAYFAPRFASKLAALGLGVDVVSLGELRVAQRAGFSPEKIHLHGNNKSAAELRAALELNLQAIVVDSLDELMFLESLARERQHEGSPRPESCPKIWLRITPGLTVDTHAYRQTGHHTTKFGIPIADGQAAEAIRYARNSPHLNLVGLHTHLGSQVYEAGPYVEALQMLYALARAENFTPLELSPGGGWYVRYTSDAPDIPLNTWVQSVAAAVQAECDRSGIPLPRLVLEPGRWLAARAGVALYTVGTCKNSGDGTRWVAVDGGMADNLRPALYGARYTAIVPERMEDPATERVNLVGKFCESGDFLIENTYLPPVARGDLLALPASGAYHLSMASNYNLAERPAALWLEEGEIEVLQPHEDILSAAWWNS